MKFNRALSRNRGPLPDYHLETVEAVTIGSMRFSTVKAIGTAHVLISAPYEQQWPRSIDVKKWGGRVKGIPPDHALYLVPATGLVLHRRAARHANP